MVVVHSCKQICPWPLYSTVLHRNKAKWNYTEVGQNQPHRLLRVEIATYLSM